MSWTLGVQTLLDSFFGMSPLLWTRFFLTQKNRFYGEKQNKKKHSLAKPKYIMKFCE